MLTREGQNELASQIERLSQSLASIEQQMSDISLSENTSENKEYQELREACFETRGRIALLEQLLAGSTVISGQRFSTAQPGSRLRLENHRICLMFQLVSSPEANPRIGKISSESPIGSSILGKRVGDCVVVPTPLGKIDFQIKSIG